MFSPSFLHVFISGLMFSLLHKRTLLLWCSARLISVFWCVDAQGRIQLYHTTQEGRSKSIGRVWTALIAVEPNLQLRCFIQLSKHLITYRPLWRELEPNKYYTTSTSLHVNTCLNFSDFRYFPQLCVITGYALRTNICLVLAWFIRVLSEEVLRSGRAM
jgi:hypothetical protein